MPLGLLGGLKNSIAFLTIIPVGMDEDGLAQAAKYMQLFPFVGAIIGFAAGAFVWALDAILPPLIVGMLGLGFILLLTGAHHTDGLLDFGDAIMYHGAREEKIRIMHDPMTGAGGLALGLTVLTTTAFGISNLNLGIVIQSLVASEAAAKFAMLLQASVGRSAWSGMNKAFVDAMHDKMRGLRLATGLVILSLVTVPTLQLVGIAVVVSAVLTAAIMLVVSNSQFGGITGDVMGATNDLARLASLLSVLGALKWL